MIVVAVTVATAQRRTAALVCIGKTLVPERCRSGGAPYMNDIRDGGGVEGRRPIAVRCEAEGGAAAEASTGGRRRRAANNGGKG